MVQPRSLPPLCSAILCVSSTLLNGNSDVMLMHSVLVSRRAYQHAGVDNTRFGYRYSLRNVCEPVLEARAV